MRTAAVALAIGMLWMCPAQAGQKFNPFTGKPDYCLTLEESDGSPSDASCGKVLTGNGSLTNNGDGTYTLAGASLSEDSVLSGVSPSLCFTPTSGSSWCFHLDPGGTPFFLKNGSTFPLIVDENNRVYLGATEYQNCAVLSTAVNGAIGCASAGSGTVTSITAGTGLSGGTITTSGTISLTTPVAVANGGTGVTTSTGTGSVVLGTTPTFTTSLSLAASGDTYGLHAEPSLAYFKNTTDSVIAWLIDSANGIQLGDIGFAPPYIKLITDGTGNGELAVPLSSIGVQELDIANTTTDGYPLTYQASTGRFLWGVIGLAAGGTGLSSASDDTILVSNGSAWQAKAVADCQDTGGNHLNYTQSSNAVSCGTSVATHTHTFTLAGDTGSDTLTVGGGTETIAGGTGITTSESADTVTVTLALSELTSASFGSDNFTSLTLTGSGDDYALHVEPSLAYFKNATDNIIAWLMDTNNGVQIGDVGAAAPPYVKIITDGTGDAELALPTASIGANEIDKAQAYTWTGTHTFTTPTIKTSLLISTTGDTYGLHAEPALFYIKNNTDQITAFLIDSSNGVQIGDTGASAPPYVKIITDGTGNGELSVPLSSIGVQELDIANTPANAQILSYQASTGRFLWANDAGGSGTPGGSDTQVQYNNASSFGGSSGLTLNATQVTGLTFSSGAIASSVLTTGLSDETGTGVAVFGTSPTFTTSWSMSAGGDTYGCHAESSLFYCKNSTDQITAWLMDSLNGVQIGDVGFAPPYVKIITDGTGDGELAVPTGSIGVNELAGSGTGATGTRPATYYRGDASWATPQAVIVGCYASVAGSGYVDCAPWAVGDDIGTGSYFPVSMTCKNFIAFVDTAPGVGKSWQMNVAIGGVNSAVTCTISGGSAKSCADTTNTVVVTSASPPTAGTDNVLVSFNPSGAPTSKSGFGWSMQCNGT